MFFKDLFSFFNTPIAYVITSIFLVIAGWFFFSRFFLFGQLDMRLFFEQLPFIYVFIVPLVTMRLLSEEFSTGSYELLLTMPLHIRDIVVGKFLAASVFLFAKLIPTFSYVICLFFLGDLDLGPVIGGYLGSFFLGSAFVSIGIFSSALTKNQIIAAIISVAICFSFFLVDKVLFFFPAKILGPLQYLSADYHFQNIAKGVIDSRDIIYFLSVIAVFLFSAKTVLERNK
ncbi:MAG: ABC transporter permease subunit [Actinomycetia bacterium]|nr:ABC transporter permease subunit [Actinomycetes bacterium]